MLRRTKQTQLDGEPIVKLPERRLSLERREFSAPERSFYQKLEAEAADSMKAGRSYFISFHFAAALSLVCAPFISSWRREVASYWTLPS